MRSIKKFSAMEENTQKPGCCSCEADFKKEIEELEKEGTAPTEAEREKKRREVDAAFRDEKEGKR